MADPLRRDDWASKAHGWVRNQRVFDHAFTPFTDALLAAARIGTGMRVLDVGCGAGTLLQAALDAGAEAVGVDIAEAMVAAARERAPRASVHRGDAQTADLLALDGGTPFDRVISRFGVMFFSDPTTAFANLRAACAAGGELAFVSWREGETDLFTYGLEPLRAELADPPGPPADDTAGPMGLATQGHVGSVLRDAGWVDVEVVPLVGTCDFGLDGSDGVDERLSVALAGTVGIAVREELFPIVGQQAWDALCEKARSDMRRRMVRGSVCFDSRAWLVTARNPLVRRIC